MFKQPRLFGGADVHELVQHVGASLPKLGSVAAEHGDLQDVLRTGADFRVILAGAKMVYPLVNVYIAMDKSQSLIGKSTISTRPFSIAMLNYQRVLKLQVSAGWWLSHPSEKY